MSFSSPSRRQLPPGIYRLAMLISAALFVYLFWRLGCNVIEIVRFIVGTVLLWLPVVVLLYVVLRDQVPDRTIRFTLSAIGSYALTTFSYFVMALLGLAALFPALQFVIVGAAIVYEVRRLRLRPSQLKSVFVGWRPPELDWILIALIAASLVVAIPFKDYVTVQPNGDRTYHIWIDNLYYTGLSYELARHTPPLQMPSRAELPDPAYHMFPHLTTMLIARYTSQPDMLRALQIYDYSVIEALLCLAIYSIASTLTRSRWGGYMGVALLYVVALALPPLTPSSQDMYNFTLFPHLTNGVEATALPSPQMYSGIVVMYGGLLAVLLISVRAADDPHEKPIGILLIVCALLVGTTLRFRLHVALVMLPGFLLLCLFMAWRKRRPIFLAAGALAVILSLLLYLEMLSPGYLPGSTSLRIGYNGLTHYDMDVTPAGGVDSWPFALNVFHALKSVLGPGLTFDWTWQVVCLTAFTLLNIVGIPLLITLGFFLATRSARREFGLFSFLICWMTIMTIAGAILLTVDYDAYSVGGQLPPHAHWYLFPLAALAPWAFYRTLTRRLRWRKMAWFVVGMEVVAIFFIAQQIAPESRLRFDVRQGFTLTAEEWQALSYLHDRTAQNTVILAVAYSERMTHIMSGLTGRASYAERTTDPVEHLLQQLYPNQDRLAEVNRLWATTDRDAFCKTLLSTNASVVVEYVTRPLAVHDAPCLQPEWTSTAKNVTIWQVTGQTF